MARTHLGKKSKWYSSKGDYDRYSLEWSSPMRYLLMGLATQFVYLKGGEKMFNLLFAFAADIMDWLIRIVTYFSIMYSVAMFIINPIAKRIRKRYAEQEALDMARLNQLRKYI